MLHYDLEEDLRLQAEEAAENSSSDDEEQRIREVHERATNEILLVRSIGLLEDTLAARKLTARLSAIAGVAPAEPEVDSDTIRAEIAMSIRQLQQHSAAHPSSASASDDREKEPSEKYSSWAIAADDVEKDDEVEDGAGDDDDDDDDDDDEEANEQFTPRSPKSAAGASKKRFLDRLMLAAQKVKAAKTEAEYLATVLRALAAAGTEEPSDARARRKKKKDRKKPPPPTEGGAEELDPLASLDGLMRSQSFSEVVAGLFPGMVASPPPSPRPWRPPPPPPSSKDQEHPWAGGDESSDGEDVVGARDSAGSNRGGEINNSTPSSSEQQQQQLLQEQPLPTEATLRVPIAVVAALTTTPPAAPSGQPSTTPSRSGGASHEVRDVSEHQSIRDVERDTLCLNGELISGAALGYDGVVARLVAVERTLLPASMQDPYAGSSSSGGGGGGGGGSAYPNLPLRNDGSMSSPLSPALQRPSLRFQDLSRQLHSRTQLETFAKMALRAVNRTESGHWSLELIAALCANDRCAQIVPDSRAAGPLTVNITSGPVRINNPPSVTRMSPGMSPSLMGGSAGAAAPSVASGGTTMGWGLRAVVEATTVYNFYDPDMSRVILRIRSRFSHRLAMPLNVGSPMHLARRGVAWERLGSAGDVTLEASLVTKQQEDAPEEEARKH
jgi:hypothetical protein